MCVTTDDADDVDDTDDAVIPMTPMTSMVPMTDRTLPSCRTQDQIVASQYHHLKKQPFLIAHFNFGGLCF